MHSMKRKKKKLIFELGNRIPSSLSLSPPLNWPLISLYIYMQHKGQNCWYIKQNSFFIPKVGVS